MTPDIPVMPGKRKVRVLCFVFFCFGVGHAPVSISVIFNTTQQQTVVTPTKKRKAEPSKKGQKKGQKKVTTSNPPIQKRKQTNRPTDQQTPTGISPPNRFGQGCPRVSMYIQRDDQQTCGFHVYPTQHVCQYMTTSSIIRCNNINFRIKQRAWPR